MRALSLTLLLFLSIFYGVGQNPVNAFANVAGISGTSLTVDNVSETYDSFEDGNYVIIMQMQDNVIGTNTTNASSFGDAGSILSAGLYEVVQIASHAESSSIPTSIVFTNPLVNTYNINSNASVQLITFRKFAGNFTSTTNIGTAAWNGTVGGVTAIWVPGQFTLRHSISADGTGFRGGSKNTPNGYSTCQTTTYIASSAITYFAGKGEGIYKNTNTSWSGARGKILNGGGGGNDTNAGGAGGGNYLSGGDGGTGWVPAGTGCSPSSGGLGGLSLSTYISNSRIFMGGGGGGGQENDGVGTVGTSGGGIVLLRTNTLVTNACSGVAITANGVNVATAQNDGAGGGGAGGSIMMQVDSYSIASVCQLTVAANGGNGGNSNTGGGDAHGGGGGGGQGVVIYSTPQPTVNVSTNTVPGIGGKSCGSCTSQNASSGSGTSNTGIVPNSGNGPLPVELISFSAVANDDGNVLVSWVTAIEKNNRYFILQHMNSAGNIKNAATVDAKGNYSTYHFTDLNAENGINYYRLNQVDLDGTSHLRNWASISISKAPAEIVIHPNPVSSTGELIAEYTNLYNEPVQIVIIDMLGKTRKVLTTTPNSNHSQVNIAIDDLQPGIYLIRFTLSGTPQIKKLIVTD